MRVISQDGTIDIPYENSSLSVFFVEYAEPKRTIICCRNSCLKEEEKIAEYSTIEKAIKAMEMLRYAYASMPIVMQNVDVSEDVAKEFERLNKCGVMVRVENQPSKVDFINNAIFQFPQDNEIEV